MTADPAGITSPSALPLRDVLEAARRANCGQCWQPPGVPCARGPGGAGGYHVARLCRAFRRGLLPGPDLVAVLQALTVFQAATVVWDTAGGPGRDGGRDEGEGCPRCGAAAGGMAADGRLECTRCLGRDTAVAVSSPEFRALAAAGGVEGGVS
jgi:hypothetical protein